MYYTVLYHKFEHISNPMTQIHLIFIFVIYTADFLKYNTFVCRKGHKNERNALKWTRKTK